MILRLLTLSVFLMLFSGAAHAQELSPERKWYVLKNLQNDIFRLPYEMDYITGTLVPETQAKRAELAPHYPDVSTLERNEAVIDQAFLNWVTIYSHEYEGYKNYLEVFLRSHANH